MVLEFFASHSIDLTGGKYMSSKKGKLDALEAAREDMVSVI